jgi:hypothetical protein
MNWSRLLPLSGVVAVALIIISFAIAGEPPDVDALPDDLLSYYTDDSLQIGAALLALGSFFFLIFSSTLSTALGERRDTGATAARVSFAGGIVFTVGMAIFAGIAFTAGEVAEDVDPGTLQTLNALEVNMFFPVAVGAAAYFLGSGIGILKTGLLPACMGWVAVVLGVLAITPAGFAAFVGLGVWTLIASAMLAMRAGAVPMPGVD